MAIANTLTLTSPAFENGELIPAKYTSDGQDVNPPLMIEGLSPKAKSLALLVDDPDAATDPNGPGQTFDHWVLFNIPAETSEIAENSVPNGAVVGLNGARQDKYLGPAPPTGEHRYFFRLYELSDLINLDETATKADIEEAMRDKVIDQTELVGKYQRQSQASG